MNSFGKLLRKFRRQSTDPLKGGGLTQERFGELIGHEMGDNGYSGAAVSDWERGKSRISADQRVVLIGLITSLVKNGGLHSPDDANELLHAGNYRALDATELQEIFGIDPEEANVPAIDVDLSTADTPLGQLTRKRRRQLVLLEKVRKYWLEGVLETSIPAAGPIELSGIVKLEAVADSWDGLNVEPETQLLSLTDTALLQLFNKTGRHMLILGAPGSGKTTMLLTLAAALISRAQQDVTAAIPIVLYLSSWASDQVNIEDWVIAELASKYHIPAKIARDWLDNDELLLLLDGFDRIPAPLRGKCVLAINQFRHDYGFIEMVVCSRLLEYQQAQIKLDLGGAIELQPLAADQVQEYIDAAGSTYDEFRNALRTNETLQDLVQTPLLVSVVQSVYQQGRSETIPDNFAANEDRLIEAYMDHILNQNKANAAYSTADTRRWLGWLAKNMAWHNQNMFLQEFLQPSWLSSRRWQWFYLLITRLWDGAVISIVLWLLLQQYRLANSNVPVGPSEPFAEWLGTSLGWADLWILVIGNALLSLLIAVVHAIQFGFQSRPMADRVAVSRFRPQALQVIAVGLIVAVVTTLGLMTIAEPTLAFIWGVIEGAVFMIFARYIHGRNFATEVRTVAALNWSWLNAIKGLLFGLIAALFTEIVEIIYLSQNGFWESIISYAAVGILLGGLNGERIEQETRSNQGVWLAINNALLAVVATAPLMGLIASLVWSFQSGLLIASIMVCSSLALFGGSNLVKHLIIRGLIWADTRVPVGLTDFLDYATELALLRRVGGGYIFIHDLLLERLARQD